MSDNNNGSISINPKRIRAWIAILVPITAGVVAATAFYLNTKAVIAVVPELKAKIEKRAETDTRQDRQIQALEIKQEYIVEGIDQLLRRPRRTRDRRMEALRRAAEVSDE